MIPIRSYSHTDVGLKRDNNEDSHLADDDAGLYIVADGMGGHAAGEVASQQVIDSVRASFIENWDQVHGDVGLAEPEHRAALEELMREAVLRACKDVHELARKDLRKAKMGSTCVALLRVQDKAVIGHVGDSRVYLFRNGSLHRLTEDHTLGAEQVRRGFLTDAQAKKLPTHSILLRAVGVEPAVAVDTLVTDLYQGDSILLCSDGLYGELTEAELVQRLSRRDLKRSAAELVELANARGGKDNSTAIVIGVGEVEASTGDSSPDLSGKLDVLRTIPLFEQLSYLELLELLSISTTRRFQPGEAIITEGEEGQELFAITRGKVDVQRSGQSLAQLKAGGYFGEMVMFDDSLRSATVVALEPSSVVVLQRDGLMALMKRNAELSNKLLWSFSRILALRLRATSMLLAKTKAELESKR